MVKGKGHFSKVWCILINELQQILHYLETRAVPSLLLKSKMSVLQDSAVLAMKFLITLSNSFRCASVLLLLGGGNKI